MKIRINFTIEIRPEDVKNAVAFAKEHGHAGRNNRETLRSLFESDGKSIIDDAVNHSAESP